MKIIELLKILRSVVARATPAMTPGTSPEALLREIDAIDMHVIAAAPDLLETLKEIADIESASWCRHLAKCAIAKAEGKSE